jgi:hypothetical protein
MLINHSILIVFVIAVCVVYYFRHIKEGMKKGKGKTDSKKDSKIKGERTSGKNTSKTEILKNKASSFIPKWAL